MSQMTNGLPDDILFLIFRIIQNDYSTLFQCSLVNWAFNRAASKFLYHRVVLAPHFSSVLALRDTSSIPATSNLLSATLPQYANLVEIVEITGFPTARPPPRSTLSTTILNAITTFKNIRVAILTPATYHEDIFTQVLKYFASPPSSSSSLSQEPTPSTHGPPNLCELTVNTSCTDESRAPLLSEITGLSKLTIYSPTRAILQLLPVWLHRLSDSLTELHLKNNCGSVTPGVLKSVIPLLERNIRSLSLGLSYSLTDDDLFAFLNRLPKLERVELRYYWQLRTPIHLPELAHLRELTVQHTKTQTRKEAQSLCKWIRWVITFSPIHTLRLVCDNDSPRNNSGANVSFGSIVDHLCHCHHGTLRVLDLGSAYVGVKPLRQLLGNCKELEEISLCAGRHALAILRDLAPSLSNLHTASFDIRNIKPHKRRIINMKLITEILDRGSPSLRRLTINGKSWESTWEPTQNGLTLALIPHEQTKILAPWEQVPKSNESRSPTASSSGISATGRPRVSFG